MTTVSQKDDPEAIARAALADFGRTARGRELFQGELSLAKMPGGASTRKFFRVTGELSGRAVLMYVPKPSQEVSKARQAQNSRPFVEVAALLHERGVAVPDIYHDDAELNVLLVEDLGDLTLAEFLKVVPQAKEALYQEAVRGLARAQLALAELPSDSIIRTRAFDQDLLLWEIQHFHEYGLEARGIELSPAERELFERAAQHLAHSIAAKPRGFTHRDFQSRNLMLRPHAAEAFRSARPATNGDTGSSQAINSQAVNGQAVNGQAVNGQAVNGQAVNGEAINGEPNGAATLTWIDFQDAMLGPRVYDLVALLTDSYQTFDRPFVERRLREYAEALGVPDEYPAIVAEFDLVTVQRKLKDAGRFVFLDRVNQAPHFLEYVEPTIDKVLDALGRLDSSPELAALRSVLLARLRPSRAPTQS